MPSGHKEQGLMLGAVALPPAAGLLIGCALIGAAAGAIRAAQRPIPRAAVRDVLTQSAGGGLTAFLVGAVCAYYMDPAKMLLIVAIAGVAGWVGTVTLDRAGVFLSAQIDRRFNGTTPQPPPSPERPPP